MSRRLALWAASIGALCLAAGAAGCAATAERGEAGYGALEPAMRLLTVEADGPHAVGAAEALGDLLKDQSLPCRAGAAQTLGAWAAATNAYLALPALTAKEPIVRGMAQAGYIEHNAYGLAPLVTEGNIIEVPPTLLQALAELGDPDGMVALDRTILGFQELLREDLESTPQTAVLAADILARVGDAGARRALIWLVEGGEGLVLAKAARACVRDGMGLGPTLLPMAFGGGVEAKRAVMAALVAAPDPHMKALALRGLRASDPTVRHNAIRALGNLSGGAPVDALTARLLEPGGEKRDILRALGVIGKPAADALRDYLRRATASDELQVIGLLALAPNANRDDIAWIAPRLKSDSKYMRAAAAAALGKIGHPSAQAAVMTAVGDSEPLVRAAAAKALGQIGTVYGAKQLIVMLEDPSALVSSMAAWGLGATAYADAVPALKKEARTRLSTEASPSRIGEMYGWPELAAVEALGRIGTDEAVAFLREAIESKSWLMRATAAQALGAAGKASPETVKVLQKHLRDPVNLVRAQALVSLKSLSDTPPAPEPQAK